MTDSCQPAGYDRNVIAGRVRSMIQSSIDVKRKIIDGQIDDIIDLANVCTDHLVNGGKLLLCGNGGSAADAQHLAAEFLVRLRPKVSRAPIAAIALAMDTSSLTACGNDFSYEVFFERMLQGVGRKGDVLIGISTSGNSTNVLRAVEAARAMGITTIGLLGNGGGVIAPACDHALVIPTSETARIQESHITVGHVMFELIEDELIRRGFIELR